MRCHSPLINASIVETEIDGKKHYLLPMKHVDLIRAEAATISYSVAVYRMELEAYIPQPTSVRVFLHEGNIGRGVIRAG